MYHKPTAELAATKLPGEILIQEANECGEPLPGNAAESWRRLPSNLPINYTAPTQRLVVTETSGDRFSVYELTDLSEAEQLEADDGLLRRLSQASQVIQRQS